MAVAAAGWVGVSSPGDYVAFKFPPLPRHDQETRLLLNGEERWVLAEAIPRLTEDGIWIWEGVIHDITSQKLSERALQAANKKILEIMREKNQQDKGM
jgi:hypothetical protein